MSAGRARASAGPRSPPRPWCPGAGWACTAPSPPPASVCHRRGLAGPCPSRRLTEPGPRGGARPVGTAPARVSRGRPVRGPQAALRCPLPSGRPSPRPRGWCWRSGSGAGPAARSPGCLVPPGPTSPRPSLQPWGVRSRCSSGRCALGEGAPVTCPPPSAARQVESVSLAAGSLSCQAGCRSF